MKQPKTNKKNTKKVKTSEELKKGMDAMSKCLAITLLMSKDTFDNLTPDQFKKLFGDWKLRELRMLNNLYKEITKG